MMLQQALNHGLQLHRAGRLQEAETVYRQILVTQPNQPDALHFLGLVSFELHHTNEALELLRRAIAINPSAAGYRCNLGRILAESNQSAEAISAYREALRLEPQNADAWNNLGVELFRQDQLNDAVEAYNHAIRLRPQFAEARNNLGQTVMTAGQLDQAIALFRESIKLNPQYVAAYTNLGIALKRQSQLTEARNAFQLALSLQPANPTTRINFGKILLATGEIDQAIAIFEQVNQSHAQNGEAHCNLGEAMLAKGQLEEAIESLERAFILNPTTADMYNNLGHAFHNAGRFDRAIECYTKAIELKHDWPLAKYNLGITRLLQGDFETGWRLYESRFNAPDLGRNFLEFPQPRWNGTELNGRRILLHAEQANGDTIQFIRYASLVAQRGGKVILQVQPDLVNLMTQLPQIEQVLPIGQPAPAFDEHCPLLSLPSIFGIASETVPYLHSDKTLREQWNDRIGNEARLKVGLVWAGRATHLNDRTRSIALATLAPLSTLTDIAFYSLQKGSAAEQLRDTPNDLTITDWTQDLHDFTDTAALIDNLDLVISVDTAVAHLAGAMGKSVWTLLPFVPDWRWLMDRSDSPWYPTMRLFRQTRPGEWDAPIQEIVRSLQELKINPQ